MTITVCLCANTIGYPKGGGHQWVYLNWALGLRGADCRVFWMEAINPGGSPSLLQAKLTMLKERLEPYGLGDSIVLCSKGVEPLSPGLMRLYLGLDDAAGSDLLLNFFYGLPLAVVARFRRSALVDIDPGLLQFWMGTGQVAPVAHDLYFTTGETVGRPETRFTDAGIDWIYTPPCVALDRWLVREAPTGAPYTTVSHWAMPDWIVSGDEVYRNDKRAGFLPYLDLPRHVAAPIELALCLTDEEEAERSMLRERGWGVRDAWEVTSTPWDYQRYVRNSRGEFSCVKPSCVRFQNAWVSDRTLCYLASGKPAVVEHTGPSRFLPDADGLLRFHTFDEAVAMFKMAETEYERHCRSARALTETYFSAKTVAKAVLERALA